MFNSPQDIQKVVGFLDDHKIPYMLIGGLVVSIWGETRVTHDADFKVSIDMPLADFRRLVLERFPERSMNIPDHRKSAHIVHVFASPEVAVDLLVSIFDYEKEAIKRAVVADLLGLRVRVCGAEDLIIHKAISNRSKDWIDVAGILLRQRGKLDVRYIRDWLTQFAEGLESPEILQQFEQLYAEANS